MTGAAFGIDNSEQNTEEPEQGAGLECSISRSWGKKWGSAFVELATFCNESPQPELRADILRTRPARPSLDSASAQALIHSPLRLQMSLALVAFGQSRAGGVQHAGCQLRRSSIGLTRCELEERPALKYVASWRKNKPTSSVFLTVNALPVN